MSYEIDLKIQRLLAEKQKPPMGYIAEVDWFKTEVDPRVCTAIERKIYGKPLSKKQRRKTWAKIEFFKTMHKLFLMTKNSTPSELEKRLDRDFEDYLNKNISTKEFGERFQKINMEEIDAQ